MGESIQFQQTDWMVWARCPQDLSWGRENILFVVSETPTRIRPGQPVLRWTRKGTVLGKTTHVPHAFHDCTYTCVIRGYK